MEVLNRPINLLFPLVLSLIWIAGAEAAVTIQGDLPWDGVSYFVKVYNGSSADPCPGTEVIGSAVGVSGDSNYTDGDDYAITFTYPANPDVWVYFCTGEAGVGDLRLSYNLGSVIDGGSYEIDLGKLIGTNLHVDLNGTYVYVCDSLGGNFLSSALQPVDNHAYTQYYAKNASLTEVYILFNATAPTSCVFNSLILTSKRIGIDELHNYGVYYTYAPEVKLTGDLHSQLASSTLEVFDASTGEHLGMRMVGSTDGLNDVPAGGDDFVLYYDNKTNPVRIKVKDSTGNITQAYQFTVGPAWFDLVVRVSGTLPTNITEIRTNVCGLNYVTSRGASSAYNLWLPDNECAGTDITAAIEFAEVAGKSAVFSKSITISNVTVGPPGYEDETINVAEVYGGLHPELTSYGLVDVYPGSLCSGSRLNSIDAIKADNNYRIYFEGDRSTTYYVRTNYTVGTSYFINCGNAFTTSTASEATLDLTSEIEGNIPLSIAPPAADLTTIQPTSDYQIVVDSNYDLTYSGSDVFTSNVNGEYHLFTSPGTRNVYFNYTWYEADEKWKIVLNVSRSLGAGTYVLNVGYLNGTINASFVSADSFDNSNVAIVSDYLSPTLLSSKGTAKEYVFDYLRDVGDGTLEASSITWGDIDVADAVSLNDLPASGFVYWKPAHAYTINTVSIHIAGSTTPAAGSANVLRVYFGEVASPNDPDTYGLDFTKPWGAADINIDVNNLNTWYTATLNNTISVTPGVWYALWLMYDPDDNVVPDIIVNNNITDAWLVSVDLSVFPYENFDTRNATASYVQVENGVPGVRLSYSGYDLIEAFYEARSKVDLKLTDASGLVSYYEIGVRSDVQPVAGGVLTLNLLRKATGNAPNADVDYVTIFEGLTNAYNLTVAEISPVNNFAMYFNDLDNTTVDNTWWFGVYGLNHLLLKRNKGVTSTSSLNGYVFNVAEIQGVPHSDLSAGTVRVYNAANCLTELSSEALPIPLGTYYKQFYETDGAGNIYLNVSVGNHWTCIDTEIVDPGAAQVTNYHINVSVKGQTATGIDTVKLDVDKDGTAEIFGNIYGSVAPLSYSLYFNGSSSAFALFYNGAILELNRTHSLLNTNNTINVGKVLGAAHSDLSGNTYIEVYNDAACSNLLSSETKIAGTTYTQFFEDDGSTTFYLKVIYNATGVYSYPTCGNAFTLTNEERDIGIERKIFGLVPDEGLTGDNDIASVRLIVANSQDTNTSVNTATNLYFIFTNKSVSDSTLEYLDSSFVILLKRTRDITSDTSLNVSKIIGEIHPNLSGASEFAVLKDTTVLSNETNPVGSIAAGYDYEVFFEHPQGISTFVLAIQDANQTALPAYGYAGPYLSYLTFGTQQGGTREFNINSSLIGRVTTEPCGNAYYNLTQVNVTIYNDGTSVLNSTSLTASDGTYRMYLEAGTYDVNYTKDSYVINKTDLSIGANTANDVELLYTLKLFAKSAGAASPVSNAWFIVWHAGQQLFNYLEANDVAQGKYCFNVSWQQTPVNITLVKRFGYKPVGAIVVTLAEAPKIYLSADLTNLAISPHAQRVANESITWEEPMVLNATPVSSAKLSFDLRITTDENAVCKFDLQPKSFTDMQYLMSTQGLTHNYTFLAQRDALYAFYIKCIDEAGNAMTQAFQLLTDVDTRANYRLTVPREKHEYFAIGWNSFFLPRLVLEDLGLTNFSVSPILTSISGNYKIIFYHNGSAWQSYEPGRPINDLTEFADVLNKPYWIKMLAEDRIEIA